jgi:hypothetical protein
MDKSLIEIKLPSYTVFLTQDEIQSLLRQDKVIWNESIKRGKYILRSRKQRNREQQKYDSIR